MAHNNLIMMLTHHSLPFPLPSQGTAWGESRRRRAGAALLLCSTCANPVSLSLLLHLLFSSLPLLLPLLPISHGHPPFPPSISFLILSTYLLLPLHHLISRRLQPFCTLVRNWSRPPTPPCPPVRESKKPRRRKSSRLFPATRAKRKKSKCRLSISFVSVFANAPNWFFSFLSFSFLPLFFRIKRNARFSRDRIVSLFDGKTVVALLSARLVYLTSLGWIASSSSSIHPLFALIIHWSICRTASWQWQCSAVVHPYHVLFP